MQILTILIYVLAVLGALALYFVITSVLARKKHTSRKQALDVASIAQGRFIAANEAAWLIFQCFFGDLNTPTRLSKERLLHLMAVNLGDDNAAEKRFRELRSLGLIEKHKDLLGTIYYLPSDVFKYRMPILPRPDTLDKVVPLMHPNIASEASTFRLAIYFIFCRDTGNAQRLSEQEFFGKVERLEKGGDLQQLVDRWIGCEMITVQEVNGERFYSVGPVYDLSYIQIEDIGTST